MDKIPITRPGYEKLKKDLEYMKRVAVTGKHPGH